MTQPIALGAGSMLPPSPPSDREKGGARDLTVATPGKRVAVVDRMKVDPKVVQAAEGMEAMFLDYLLKTMRQTVPKSEMDLENPATEIYRGMLDSEVAQRAARVGGVGLADQIIAYLQPQSYALKQGHGAPESDPTVDSRRTGGTHEGQSKR